MKRIFLLNVLLLCLAIVAGCSAEKQADSTQNGVSDKPATENASHTEVNVDPRSLVSLDEVKMIFNQEVIYTEMEKIGPMLLQPSKTIRVRSLLLFRYTLNASMQVTLKKT